MTTALKPVEEITRYSDTDTTWLNDKSDDWYIEYICHMAARLRILDRVDGLAFVPVEGLRSIYNTLVTTAHPSTGRDFVTRWSNILDTRGRELIVKFLNKEYQDGFTPSGWPVTGINHFWQIAEHVIPNSVLWTAEKWAISVLAGEKLKENMTPEDLERQIIEAWRALP